VEAADLAVLIFLGCLGLRSRTRSCSTSRRGARGAGALLQPRVLLVSEASNEISSRNVRLELCRQTESRLMTGSRLPSRGSQVRHLPGTPPTTATREQYLLDLGLLR
jgi:hypothetical protein